MDFRTQYFNNITIESTEQYDAICAQAEIPARAVKKIAHSEYRLTYAEFNATEWAAMTREERCRQVIDAAYLKHLLIVAKNRKYARDRETVRVATVRCDCGHDVPRRMVMNASMGTSCPRCYDRMSD